MIRGIELVGQQPRVTCSVQFGEILDNGMQIVGDVKFLIDTAAHRSVIMPNDALRLGLYGKHIRLGMHYRMQGLGGYKKFAESSAKLMAYSAFEYIGYSLSIRIAPDDKDMYGLPSIMGMDILSDWTLITSPPRQIVRCKAHKPHFSSRV